MFRDKVEAYKDEKWLQFVNFDFVIGCPGIKLAILTEL